MADKKITVTTKQNDVKKLLGNEDSLYMSPNALSSLLSFDLRFDSLKAFLDNLLHVVNGHADVITSVKSELQTRVIDRQLKDIITRITESALIYDNDLEKLITSSKDHKNDIDVTGDIIDEATSKFCLNISSYGKAIGHLFQKNKDLEAQMIKLSKEMTNKATKEEYRGKIKKTKAKLLNRIDLIHQEVDKRLIDFEKRIQNRVLPLERKIGEVEQNTIHKIKDCEELLKTRINDQYVNDAIKTAEEKIMREINKASDTKYEIINRNYQELNIKVKSIDETCQDRLKAYKKDLEGYNDILKKKLFTDAFEEYKKFNMSKYEELDQKFRQLSKNIDILNEKDRQDGMAEERFGKLESDIQKHESDIIGLNSSIEELKSQAPQVDFNSIMKNMQISGSGSGSDSMIIDFKRQIDNEINNLKFMISELQKGGSSIPINLREIKDDSMDSKLDQKIDEKLRKIQKDIQDILKKFDTVYDNVDRRISLLRKDLDIPTITKMIKSKAEEEEVKKGFYNVDSKISNMNEIINGMKKTLITYKKQLLAQYGTKKGTIVNCLSCGRPESGGIGIQTLAQNLFETGNKLGKPDDLNDDDLIPLVTDGGVSKSQTVLYSSTTDFKGKFPEKAYSNPRIGNSLSVKSLARPYSAQKKPIT